MRTSGVLYWGVLIVTGCASSAPDSGPTTGGPAPVSENDRSADSEPESPAIAAEAPGNSSAAPATDPPGLVGSSLTDTISFPTAVTVAGTAPPAHSTSPYGSSAAFGSASSAAVLPPPEPRPLLDIAEPSYAQTVCDAPILDVAATPDLAAVEALLVGTWTACAPGSLIGGSDVGLQIDADHFYSLLERDADGNLQRGVGGGWEYLDTSSSNGPGAFQLNLSLNGGTMIVHAAFASNVTRMYLNNSGVYPVEYARTGPYPEAATGAYPTSAQAPALPSAEQLAALRVTCASATPAPNDGLTQTAFNSQLHGVWIYCDAAEGSAQGIEITEDGRWYDLVVGTEELHRGEGFENQGRFEVLDTQHLNGPGAFQLNLHRFSTDMNFESATWSSEQTHIWLQRGQAVRFGGQGALDAR